MSSREAMHAIAEHIRDLEQQLATARASRRALVVQLLDTGRGIPEVAALTGLSESRVKHFRNMARYPTLPG